MTQGAPDPAISPPVRGVPLLVVAELPPDVFAWADRLRQTHYPSDRKRLGAHVTLFHGLPPSAEPAVVSALGDYARSAPPTATITGVMDLGDGTAFAVSSPQMMDIHAAMAERLHGLLQQKDARPLCLHITVQNKVPVAAARALQAELKQALKVRSFAFHGLGLYGWTGELWRRLRVFAFRGGK